MFCPRPILFVLILVLVNSVFSKKICNFTDAECISRGGRNTLKAIVSGVEGVIEPSDPMHLPNFEGEMPALKYKITNASMSGMATCQLTDAKMNNDDLSYRSELLCSQLVLSQHYEAKGFFGPVEIDGSGSLSLILNNYLIKLKGEYGKFISKIDHKFHFVIKTCYPKFKPKGTVEVDIKSPLHSDKHKSELATGYIKENTNQLEIAAQSPVLENYMKIFIQNINDYLKAVPADEVLPATV